MKPQMQLAEVEKEVRLAQIEAEKKVYEWASNKT